MRSLRAFVENGRIRTFEPLELVDGTEVEVLAPDLTSSAETPIDNDFFMKRFDPEETARLRAEYAEWEKTFDVEASKAAADRIAAIPEENTEPFSGEDHDEALYGWKKSK